MIIDSRTIAGGLDESAVQPRWLNDKLIFASDRTNWWNLYLWSEKRRTSRCARPMRSSARHSGPLGQRAYAIIDDDHLLCTLNRCGKQSIEVLTISDGTLRPIADPGTAATSVDVGAGHAAALLNYPDRPAALALYDLDQHSWTTVRSSTEMIMDAASVSSRPTGQLDHRARDRLRLVLPARQW